MFRGKHVISAQESAVFSDVIDCCAGGISQHTSIPLVSDGRIDVCADAMEVSGDVAVFFYKLHGEPTVTGTDQGMPRARGGGLLWSSTS